jgi:hypothetical protein
MHRVGRNIADGVKAATPGNPNDGRSAHDVCRNRFGGDMRQMGVRAIGMAFVAAGLAVGCGSASAPGTGPAVPAMPNPPVSGASPKASPSSVPALARPFRCPPTFTNNGSTYLPATRPGLAAAIVPGSPTEAIVCRYADVGTDGGLVQSATLTDTAALVAVLNSATQMQVGASYACAAGTGQLDLLLFSYTSGPPVGVTVELDGCSMEFNGLRLAYADTPQREALAAVVGSPSPIP